MQRKPIFDAIRRLLGRSLRRRDVAAIDAAIDSATDAVAAAPPVATDAFLSLDRVTPGPCLNRGRRIGAAGIALIKRFEGCARQRPGRRYEADPDPGTGADPWPIGWGATGPGIGPGVVWTQAQCDARLETDLARYAAEVAAALGAAATSQSQFDAMVSFHYNTGAIARATLTRRHIAGDRSGAAREFARWTRAGGRVLAGLERRRAAEAALYLT